MIIKGCFVLLVMILIVYFGMVSGTFSKMKDNGIDVTGKAKRKIPFIPILIIYLHVKWAVQNFKIDRELSFSILRMGTLKYPIALGMIIEIILEQYAEELSATAKIARIQKKKAIKRTVRKSKPIKVTKIPKNSDPIIKEYWATLMVN